MRAACDELVAAERKWEKIDRRAKAQEGIPDNLGEWFDALEARYNADKRLGLLFVGKDRSPRSNKMYNEYRKMLRSRGKAVRRRVSEIPRDREGNKRGSAAVTIFLRSESATIVLGQTSGRRLVFEKHRISDWMNRH